MPLNTKIDRQTRYIKEKEDKCLTNNQARHLHKKVESGSVFNVDILKQETDHDIDRIHDTSGKINPYCKIIVNKAERDHTILSQMEQLSILSNIFLTTYNIIDILRISVSWILEL